MGPRIPGIDGIERANQLVRKGADTPCMEPEPISAHEKVYFTQELRKNNEAQTSKTQV